MAKRKFHLTEEQEQELKHAYHQSKDGPTWTRYQAVRLYGTGYSAKEVMEITGCSWSSLMKWCRVYRTAGVSGLVDKRVGGNRARLTEEQMQDLSLRLHQYKPRDLFGPEAATPEGEFWTVEDLQRAVRQWYGVSYRSRTSYYRLLRLCGFSYQRPAKVFRSRREAAVMAFEEALEKNSSM
ncbi:MAG TPA: helix-turn-helix domain-containing protein [Caldilineae bacterium]|nr:helix-turn-helix domain-containing protein [Caldilineae bacterium]